MDIHMLMDKTLDPPYQAPFLFIDSTRDVKSTTMGKVLKYAIKKGFEKILVIDPSLMNHPDKDLRYVVPINPLDYNAPTEPMAAHVADTLRVLWNSADFTQESIITHNVRFIVEALHRGGYTLAECEQMIFPSLANQRDQIINNESISWLTRQELDRIYKTCQDKHPDRAWVDVQATLRRFGPFTHSSMKTIFGSKQGVNFQQLISDGWIILCNLDKTGTYDKPQQSLLGTAILNEVIRARERMKGNTTPFYVYIDEFSYYVTDKIADLLTMGRHLKIYLTLAHQWFWQIDNMPKVKGAVKGGCKSKFLFWTPDEDDVREMIGTMGYGGDITDREITFVLSALKKRQAAIRINKQLPRICDMRTWPDIDAEVSDQQVTEFLKHLFKSNPQLYRRTAEVWGEITHRFANSKSTTELREGRIGRQKKGNFEGSTSRTKNDSTPTGETVSVRQDGTAFEAYFDSRKAALNNVSGELPAHEANAKPDGKSKRTRKARKASPEPT